MSEYSIQTFVKSIHSFIESVCTSECNIYMLSKNIETCVESFHTFEYSIYSFKRSVQMCETRREMLSNLVGMIRVLFLG